MKQDSLFLIFILALTTGIVAVSGVSNSLFSDEIFIAKKNEVLQKEVAQAEFREKLMQERFFDYQQSVAAELGSSPVDTWAKLNVFSSTRLPASLGQEMDRSSLILAEAKTKFNNKDFEAAVRSFDELVAKYPESPYAVEARFLKTESLFLAGKLDECVESVDLLMTQFPEHKMTGYSMLRLSQILQSRNRKAEAVEILKMIEGNFGSDKELTSEAANLERSFKL